MSQTATDRHNRARGWDAWPASVGVVANANANPSTVAAPTAVEQQANLIKQVLAGRRVPLLRPEEILTLLDRVDDRDRAMLAMLLQRVHPDDIAQTLGISASALTRRRAQVRARLV